MRIRLTRRQLAAVLLAAAGGGAGFLWFRPDRAPVELPLPPPGDPNQPPTFEIFDALCRIVLARDDLDPALTRRMYEVFMDEPWGPKHIAQTYAALHDALSHQGWDRGARRAAPRPGIGGAERWFVSHLVTTWYLGVYFHEQRVTRRVTLQGALMYEAVRGLMPRPYTEHVEYGRWADPPAAGEQPK